jgi:uncharacterized membrane protein YfcA
VTYVAAVVLGVAAGGLSGMFGIGGGTLFVPTLIAVGLTQVHAEATSLLAIVPAVLVGVWRQQSYGNVRWRAAVTIGVASAAAVVGGAAVALALPSSDLERIFAVLLLLTAGQIARQARNSRERT